MTASKQPKPGTTSLQGKEARGAFMREDGESGFKSRGGPERLANALKYSWQGVREAVRVESAFRQELMLIAVLAPLAFWLPLTMIERVILIVILVQVLVVELLNSGLEAVVDRVSFERHELSRRAKDFGSAAVFLTLTLAIAVWLLIGVPALCRAVGWA
jgi:diacylglycerol kinase (ATP)